MTAYHPMILNDPAVWALPAAEFKLYAALLVFVKPDGTGAFPSNETLAEMVGVNDRSIRRLLSELEEKGVISRTTHENPDGSYRRTIAVNYVPVIARGRAEATSRPYNRPGIGDEFGHNSVIDDRGEGVADDRGHRLRIAGGRGSQITTEHSHIDHSHKNSSSRESFSGISETAEIHAAPLVAAAAARPLLTQAPRPERQWPVLRLTAEQAGLAMQLFGTTGEEKKLVEILTQEQIDTAGFLDYLLRKILEVKRSGRLKNPIGLLRKIAKEDWRPGWSDPEAEAKKRAAALYEQWREQD